MKDDRTAVERLANLAEDFVTELEALHDIVQISRRAEIQALTELVRRDIRGDV